MTNEEQLWAQAEKLAQRLYRVTTEIDTLSDGQEVYLLRNPELRGCMAQGATKEEAERNLGEARVDYIFSLLADGLPVPAPEMSASGMTSSVVQIPDQMFFDGSGEIDDIESTLDDHVFRPDFRSDEEGLSFGGDLVKLG